MFREGLRPEAVWDIPFESRKLISQTAKQPGVSLCVVALFGLTTLCSLWKDLLHFLMGLSVETMHHISTDKTTIVHSIHNTKLVLFSCTFLLRIMLTNDHLNGSSLTEKLLQ